MPNIKGLIVGNPQGGIVTDGRTLNGMEKSGHFVRVDSRHPCVDEQNRSRSFQWHNRKYRIEYFDGSIYPFVVLVQPNLNLKKGLSSR
jgi:hypothetical protein